MRGRTAPRLLGLALVATVALIAAPSAGAERAIAVAGGPDGQRLYDFDTATPGFTFIRPITGIAPGTELNGIDLRPSDGKIYGVARKPASAAGDDDFYTYTINPDTGAATLVGGPAVFDNNNALGVGFDFDPIADKARMVTLGNALFNDNGRIDPVTGLRFDAPNDTDLSPTPIRIRALAYDRSTFPAPTATTLFGIDDAADALVRIGGVDGTPSPDLGVVSTVAPLGRPAGDDPAFDISPQTGTGWATLQNGTDFSLNRIDLTGASPAATPIGSIHDGDWRIYGLAILPGDGPKAPPAPPGPPAGPTGLRDAALKKCKKKKKKSKKKYKKCKKKAKKLPL